MLLLENANIFTVILIILAIIVPFILDTKKFRSKKSYAFSLLLLAIIYVDVINARFTHVYWVTDFSKREEKHFIVFSEILGKFKKDVGRYPLSNEGWNALIHLPPKVNPELWRGPYLDRAPGDSWLNELVYLSEDGKFFRLYSKGKDGISKSNGNDLDDINNWDTEKHWKDYYVQQGKRIQYYRHIIYFLMSPLYDIVLIYFVIRSILFYRQSKTSLT